MIKLRNILAVVCMLSTGYFSANVLGDTEFTYQGELKQSGNPANGSFNMNFSLWDAVAGGNQIDVTNTINGIQVVDGKFTVQLDFGAEAFDNSSRWLQVGVNGSVLSPRNPITRAPYAVQTRGIFADETERVGMGTTNPAARLDVVSDTANAGNNTARFSAPSLGTNTSHIHYGTTGNWFIRSADGTGKVVLQDTGGVVNIGTSAGGFGRMRVSATGGPPIFAIDADSDDDIFPTIYANNAGSGAVLWAQGTSDASPAGGGVVVVGFESGLNIAIDSNEIMARNNGVAAGILINREGGDVIIGSASGGTSKLITPVLQITGGADFSEMFDVVGNEEVQPGMVVVIDPGNPGRLCVSTSAHDRRVVGIISGAGGVATGMTMAHDGTIANGKHPVALTGRVYCLVDTTSGAIKPGDMLTTSATPGHAMKAADFASASGAIIGKAMTSLDEGQTGLVLVLVNLQ